MTRLRSQLALLLAAWTTASLPAQEGGLGLNPITEEEWEAIPVFQPDAEGFGEFPSADLRYTIRSGRHVRTVPPVGSQRGNSCVGWAVAYATKSFHEALDQGWTPESPQRQFSPAFLYNQLNGGVDRGSSIERALQLVVNKGCATIASMSANAHYLERPSPAAMREAAMFRASGYSRLTSGSLVRAALRQGNVVIVGVNTDPQFNSGRYRLFTRQLQKKGLALRDPNSPHGRHAMCIVGYDDSIGGFLFMNSWGATWGSQVDNYRGHCWVSYELVKSIGPGAEFVNSAFALYDRKEKIGRDVTPRPDLDSLSILPLARHAGFHGGENIWTWSVQLAGDSRALEQVTQVDWGVPAADGRIRAAVTANRARAFRVVGELRAAGRYPLGARVRLRDGTTRALKGELVVEVPTTRSFEFVQTDRYWGRGSSGKPNWEWTLQLKGSLTDLADVRSVTYHLHPTFRNPNPEVTGTAANGFAFTTRGWGTFRVRATVTLKDGSTVPLTIGLQFRDSVRDGLTLRNTARPTGTNKFGKDYYDWTAYVDGPLNKLRDIAVVRYKLHPTFSPNIRDVRHGAEWGFPLSTSGWGVFELRADVVFRDGHTEELRHRLKFRDVAASLKEK